MTIPQTADDLVDVNYEDDLNRKQHATQSQPPVQINLPQRQDSLDQDFSEHVLLTPPAQSSATNPFENLDQTIHARYDVSLISRAIEENHNARNYNAQINIIPTVHHSAGFDAASLLNGLSIQTDFDSIPHRSTSTQSMDSHVRRRSSASAMSMPRRIPSVRARLHSTAGSISPGSVISSPQITAMLDITPLPSPTMGPFETWRAMARTRSRGSSTSSRSDIPPVTWLLPTPLSPSSPRRAKAYSGISSHSRNPSEDQGTTADESKPQPRSVSEYVPETSIFHKPRQVAVSGSGPSNDHLQAKTPLIREEYLGVQRGIVTPVSLSPPQTTYYQETLGVHEDEPATKRQKLNVFTVNSVTNGQIRRYESMRELGQGTFSKVYLAVRQVQDRNKIDYRKDSVDMAGVRARARLLVAVKVVEHGPAGGADAERIEISLRREVDLLKSIKHPSLVHLKAFGTDEHKRALLVMNYCPGGDMFEMASNKMELLVPPLVRRIFAELVSAVRYLHQKFIVHRDIKLENVLLNIPVLVHSDVSDWQTLDRAVVTLTDLGLSRRIPEPPESPLLTTRCGSEDYAAPEIIMGQSYDGRYTDAWALGVLLYSLMEGRLPFDPLPGARGDPATLRARTPHRIARCDWAWVKFGDEDGNWDPEKGKDFQDAFVCVDGLLKRSTRRKPLAEIREHPWVRDGILIDGGLRWVEEAV